MSPRFSRIFFDPLASASWIASRSVTLPSPRVMRPLRSRTITPSTWRVDTFMLILYVSLSLCRRLGGCSMLDKSEFGARMQLAKVYLIHEGPDEEDAAAGAAQDVFRGERVGDVAGVEACSLGRDAHHPGVGIGLKRGGDLLGRVVGIAVEDGVDSGLAHGHGDVGDGVFVETGARREALSGVFDSVNTLQRGGKCQGNTACGGIRQSGPFSRTRREVLPDKPMMAVCLGMK